jgi:excisionase family DNA binding protein
MQSHKTLLLRVSEVARLLSISRSRAYELVASGTIPGVVRLGNSIRVRKADLEAWVAGLGGINDRGYLSGR